MEFVPEQVVPKLVKTHLASIGFDVKRPNWTVVASILSYNSKNLTYEVISVGTGIKCLPDKIVCQHPEGLVHDSHAEIICRRAFILFVFEQILALNEKKNMEPNSYLYFDKEKAQLQWRPEIKLIFYTSHSPCKTLFVL